MTRKGQVRFLGEEAVATPSPYPAKVHYADLGIMPTNDLSRTQLAVKGRHNHRLSRNARRESDGLNRPGFVATGLVRARARSLRLRSACR